MPTQSEKKKASEEVTAFALLAFAFSSVFYYLIVKGYVTTGKYDTFGLMWMPALAAIVTALVYRRSIRGFGWGPGEPKYLLLAYALPIVMAALAYVPAYLTGLAAFSGLPANLANMLLLGTVINIIYAAGEEIGWRGFFVPKLFESNRSFTMTVLYSGLIWSVWHYPIILFAAADTSGLPLILDIAGFTLQAIALGTILAWLRLKTGSVWPCVILHGATNLFLDGVFTPLTRNTGITPYIVGTVGVLSIIVYVAFALYFWSRRGEIEGNGKKENKQKKGKEKK